MLVLNILVLTGGPCDWFLSDQRLFNVTTGGETYGVAVERPGLVISPTILFATPKHKRNAKKIDVVDLMAVEVLCRRLQVLEEFYGTCLRVASGGAKCVLWSDEHTHNFQWTRGKFDRTGAGVLRISFLDLRELHAEDHRRVISL